jgi:hypothetical protein
MSDRILREAERILASNPGLMAQFMERVLGRLTVEAALSMPGSMRSRLAAVLSEATLAGSRENWFPLHRRAAVCPRGHSLDDTRFYGVYGGGWESRRVEDAEPAGPDLASDVVYLGEVVEGDMDAGPLLECSKCQAVWPVTHIDVEFG